VPPGSLWGHTPWSPWGPLKRLCAPIGPSGPLGTPRAPGGPVRWPRATAAARPDRGAHRRRRAGQRRPHGPVPRALSPGPCPQAPCPHDPPGPLGTQRRTVGPLPDALSPGPSPQRGALRPLGPVCAPLPPGVCCPRVTAAAGPAGRRGALWAQARRRAPVIVAPTAAAGSPSMPSRAALSWSNVGRSRDDTERQLRARVGGAVRGTRRAAVGARGAFGPGPCVAGLRPQGPPPGLAAVGARDTSGPCEARAAFPRPGGGGRKGGCRERRVLLHCARPPVQPPRPAPPRRWHARAAWRSFPQMHSTTRPFPPHPPPLHPPPDCRLEGAGRPQPESLHETVSAATGS
jgi:hypothetical protein